MLLTKKHKTLQHKKLSWTSQNLSKKNYFLPRPTSALMPLWMRWKENRTGWNWIKSKGYNPYWLAKNQTLLVISQSTWERSNSPTFTGWMESKSIPDHSREPSSLNSSSQISPLDLSLVSGQWFAALSPMHAYTFPQTSAASSGKLWWEGELWLWTSSLLARGYPSHQSPRAISLQS